MKPFPKFKLMANNSYLNKIMGYSFHIEMIIRRVYWSKATQLIKNKLSINKSSINKSTIINLENIKNYLIKIGLKKGDILIVHSSFIPFEDSNISPFDIINTLLDLVGEDGTLVMPVIRCHEDYKKNKKIQYDNLEEVEFEYNVKRSPVRTGIIPFYMMNKKGAITSLLPFNTITAIGPESEQMIKDELLDEFPTPNGINSPWKYCTDRNALVISLGIDLTHSLTIFHTPEDVKNEDWPVKNWYRKRKFKITHNDVVIKKTFKERKPKWGKLHFGERTLTRDLLKDEIMSSSLIDGILIESLRAKKLYDYLNSKNNTGYPYFWL
jgi:aminoglycoside 3-N-acetyltransferase